MSIYTTAVKLTLTLLCWSTVSISHASPVTLTLPLSINMAITNSHAVRIAELDAAKAALTIKKNHAGYWPTVSMTHEHTQLEKAAKPEYGSYVIARLPLFDNGRTKSLISQSREYYSGAADLLQHTKQQVAASVMLAYYDALQAREQEQLTKEALQKLAGHLAPSKLRLNSAVEGPNRDALRAEAELIHAERSHNRANYEQQQRVRKLARLLNLPSDQDISLRDAVEQPVITSLTQAVQTALQERYDLQQARKDKQAAEWGVKVAVQNTRPTVSWLFVLNDAGLPEQSWYTTVSVTANVFDGNRDKLKIQEAALAAARSQECLEQKIEQITLDAEDAYGHLQLAAQAMERAAQMVRLAETDYAKAGSAYRESEAGISGVLAAHGALITAKANDISARYDYQRCRVSLLRATGTLPLLY